MFENRQPSSSFSNFNELLVEVTTHRKLREDAVDTLTPLLPPFIYLQILKFTEIALAPYIFKEFDNWETLLNYLKEKREKLISGHYFSWSYYDPHRRKTLSPFYTFAILPDIQMDIDEELLASCRKCKYVKGIMAGTRQIGDKCTKMATEYSWNVEFPPLYQKVGFDFPLYPKLGDCPKFLWRREPSSTIKTLLRKSGREEICFFCGLPLNGIPEEDKIIHHKNPLAHGGNNLLSNLEFAHRSCHSKYHGTHPVR